MNGKHRGDRRMWRGWAAARAVVLVTGVVCVLGAVFAARDAAAGPDREQKSLRRQLTMLEKVIDATLIDSPNVRVWGNANTGGIYLPGYGIIFTAGGSLLMDSSVAEVAKKLGKIRIITGGEDDEEAEGDSKDSKAEERRAKRDADRRSRRLEGLKQEMIDVLADYGPTLNQIQPTEKVGIALFLMNESISDAWDRVVLIEVTRADLQRYDASQIDDAEFTKRVKISEY